MMVKTIAEFRDEMRSLRKEMFKKGEKADMQLLASWVDRLVISLEGLSQSLELMDVEVDTICSCCDSLSSPSSKKMSKMAAKKSKKPAKKKAAKKKKGRRR